MQETEMQGKIFREYFDGWSKEEIIAKMEKRLQELLPEGHILIRRVPSIGRNSPCPCGSGKKFKKCCISEPRIG